MTSRAGRHSYGTQASRLPLIAAAAAAAIIGLLLLVRAGGGGGPAPAPAFEGGGPYSLQPSPVVGKGGKGFIETFEVFAPKDPFAPALGGRGRATVSAGELTVALVSASAHGAKVSVDGTIYPVTEGEVFADSFKLLAAGDGCAAVLYGDDQFSFCEGDEVVK